MSDLREAGEAGQLTKVPSFTSTFRYLEDPAVTPVMEDLIRHSAGPMRVIERDFAPDSTGFASSSYSRWFDKKWGKTIRESQWVKLHIMSGVATNVVTSAVATHGHSNDITYFEPLLQDTADAFDVREVYADKAYLGKDAILAVQELGAQAYIPFKVNSRPYGGHHKRRPAADAAWAKAYHYFHQHREEFLAHYHRRSNVESTFSMIKAKFGASVRAKTPTAAVNEVLAKVLCHNICCLIRVAYRVGVDPSSFRVQTFGPGGEVLPRVI